MATTRTYGTTTAAAETALAPDVRRALKRTVLDLRHALEDDFARQLTAVAIDEQAVRSFPAGRALTAEQRRVRDTATAVIKREVAGGSTHAEAFAHVLRESAFTFLNRVMGLRCLEARRMLLVDGQTETVITRLAELGGVPSLYWRVRNAPNAPTQPRELWRTAYRLACAAVARDVRVLFDPDAEYAALFPLLPTMQRAIEALNDPVVPAEAYAEDALLGWVYQYFQSEEKDRIFAEVRTKKKKIGGEDIIPVTQLYTEQYMVDFLLQNSLGRTWMEMYPDSPAKAAWPYYVEPATPHARPRKPLKDWALLDPCVGSGHFLVVAFDLLVQLYAEERALAARDEIPAEWAVPEGEVPATILERNLYGIDIDRRATQLAALALYLKAKRAGLARAPRINVVAADASLLAGPAWQKFLASFEREPSVRRVLEAMAGYLKDIRELGSLLRPEEELKRLIAEEHRRWEQAGRPLQEALFPDFAAPRQERLAFEQASDETFWMHLAHRAEAAIQGFYDAARSSGDLDEQIVAGEAQRGFAFLELCRRRYDVVCTNPPYMGSKNMVRGLKDFVARHYELGKRDLYTAFMERCRQFASYDAYVGMVTQQTWATLTSFQGLRGDILRCDSIEAISYHGRYAFEEISNAVVKPALLTLRRLSPTTAHTIDTFRLTAPRPAQEQAALLRDAVHLDAGNIHFRIPQEQLFAVPGKIVIPVPERVIDILSSDRRLNAVARVKKGLATLDNDQFIRFFWEVSEFGRTWFQLAKAGFNTRWSGGRNRVVYWQDDGKRVKEHVSRAYGGAHWSKEVRSPELYFKPGLCYSIMAKGTLAVRILMGEIFENKTGAIFGADALFALFNTRAVTYLLRTLATGLEFNTGTVENLPLPATVPNLEAPVALKSNLVLHDPLEWTFVSALLELYEPRASGAPASRFIFIASRLGAIEATLCALEAVNDLMAMHSYEMDDLRELLLEETGIPAGWHPLIAGYDVLPDLPADLAPMPGQLTDHIAEHERVALASDQLERLKDRLRALYVAGPGAQLEDEAAEENDKRGNGEGEGEDGDEEDAAVALGARIPIPAETFVEELSQKLEVHPISVYRLLEEMRRDEGLVCPPEMKRQMEDYASVTLLRELGFRWPEQDIYEAEHGPILDPALVVADGILSLVDCGAGATVVEQIQRRLERDFGDEGAARSEAEFRRWVGRPLEEWLRRDFFKRHISQFKQRPIAWHLVSPGKTFEAFVLYHKLCDEATGRATLGRLRTVYAGGLIERLRAEQERAKAAKDEREVTRLQLAIEDVEEFRKKLEQIERGDELKARVRCRWKGDEAREGRPGPYAPDINDGVKVNIRPFQELGLLAAPVIKKWE